MSSTATDPKPVTGYPATAAVGGGSAYAYPATVPPYSGNPYYPNSNSNRSPTPPPPSYYPNAAAYPSSAGGYGNPFPNSSALVRRLIAIIIAFFLFVGLATLILWLVIRPRLPDVAVASAAVSGFNLSDSSQQLSGVFDLGLTVRNPNGKMEIYYDRLWAGVLYGSEAEPIAEASLPPFYQGKGNTTTIAAHLVAAGEYVDSDTVKGIDSDVSRAGGEVSFHFRVLAWVRFRSGIWRTRRHVMRVYCDNVHIAFKNTTAGVGSLADSSPKKCVVNI